MKKKITNESLLKEYNLDFSRNAEWFKRTLNKINEIKEQLNKNFYDENKKKEKINFIKKLKEKIKDYKDAIKFSERYKKIRFIERRKLERKLNKIKKQIENEKNEEKLKELKENLKNVENDINYVKYYPKTYKYYSLFPINDKDNKILIEKREKIRKKIEFFINEKKRKRKYLDKNNNNDENISESENDNVNNDDNIQENNNKNDKENENNNNINKKEIEINENNKDKIKTKKKKINNNKEQDDKILFNNYELKPKKIFKDNFFELDE